MRTIQKNRVPQGHRLIPINGILSAVPVGSVGMWQATQHNVGYGAGVTAHGLWLPFELAIDAGRSIKDSIAASQFGQSFQLGWDDVGTWKSSVKTLLEVRKMPEDEQRAMLIETVEGPAKRQWERIVARMTPFQVSRELANRLTPNPWIDEQLTYGGNPESYEQKPQKGQKAEEMPADEGSILEGAFAG